MVPTSDIGLLEGYNKTMKRHFFYFKMIKRFKQIRLFSLLYFVFFFSSNFNNSFSVDAKVKAPNYNFSIDQFEQFSPGKNLSKLIKKQKPKVEFQDKSFITYKFYIKHIRYKFALLVQTKDSIVTDFHARLPQYFLHDIFHQSLINRYGLQDKYKKSEESAIYKWINKNNISHVYSGACTITCFPIFYTSYIEKHSYGKSYKRIIDKLTESEF